MKIKHFSVSAILSLLVAVSAQAKCHKSCDEHLHLNQYPTKYLGDCDLPRRPPPIEFGDPLLGPGKLKEPCTYRCWGTVFNKSLWIYGLFRTTVQAFRTGNSPDASEWANRVDLFANLQLTGTERVLLHMRPVSRGNRYTLYTFHPERVEGFEDQFNANITQLFFEGDLADLFSCWQAKTRCPRDIGFAIGRQQLFFQDGIFIDDFIDAIALTQNSLAFGDVSNLQISAYVGLNNFDPEDCCHHKDGLLLGLHSRTDVNKRTVDYDLAYMYSRKHHCWHDGELQAIDASKNYLACAISAEQRIGCWGTTFRLMGSMEDDGKHQFHDHNKGALIYVETNREYGPCHDIFYINGAWSIGHFRSVARDETAGGPLGRVGILFSSPGIGDIGSALNAQANNSVVAAIGYQKFFNFNWQGVLELATRINTNTDIGDSVALGARLQAGICRRWVLRFDAFGGARNHMHSVYGVRTELVFKL